MMASTWNRFARGRAEPIARKIHPAQFRGCFDTISAPTAIHPTQAISTAVSPSTVLACDWPNRAPSATYASEASRTSGPDRQ